MTNTPFIPYHTFHILNILDGYDEQHLPLDLFISHYFRAHKALGSKDRGLIADKIYKMVRWRGLLDALCSGDVTWDQRIEIFDKIEIEDYLEKEDLPIHTRLSLPKVLYDLIVNSYGEESAKKICLDSNTPAPTVVRANKLKTTRADLLARWQELYSVAPCVKSENGIIFLKKINLFGLPEFKEGLFEVQDEGSQLLAELVAATPGELVMDYCAGSGGKTLAFAPGMQNKGQIYLHDIRKFALDEARKRLRRAGVQNAQVVVAEDDKLKKLKKKMNWVLVDAPCSGTGTMRRNPDMKWSFTDETVPRLVSQQKVIFERALSYMHPKGKIIYATCSILKEENQEQVAHFMKTYNLKLAQEPFQSIPVEGGMDGFYGAILEYQ